MLYSHDRADSCLQGVRLAPENGTAMLLMHVQLHEAAGYGKHAQRCNMPCVQAWMMQHCGAELKGRYLIGLYVPIRDGWCWIPTVPMTRPTCLSRGAATVASGACKTVCVIGSYCPIRCLPQVSLPRPGCASLCAPGPSRIDCVCMSPMAHCGCGGPPSVEQAVSAGCGLGRRRPRSTMVPSSHCAGACSNGCSRNAEIK